MSATESVQPALLKNVQALYQAASNLVAANDALKTFNTPTGEPFECTSAALKELRQRSQTLYAEHDAAESALRQIIKRIEDAQPTECES